MHYLTIAGFLNYHIKCSLLVCKWVCVCRKICTWEACTPVTMKKVKRCIFSKGFSHLSDGTQSPALQGNSYQLSHQGSPLLWLNTFKLTLENFSLKKKCKLGESYITFERGLLFFFPFLLDVSLHFECHIKL